MRIIERHIKTYIVAAGLCISMSPLLIAIAGVDSASAKTAQEAIYESLTGRNTTDPAPTPSATPSPTPTPSVSLTPSPTPQVQRTTTKTTQTQPARTATQPRAAVTVKAIPVTQDDPAPVEVAAQPAPADTSAQVRQVAVAQAKKTNFPSSYPSARISTSERDGLYKASLIVAAIGSLIYLLSYAPMSNWIYRNSIAPSKIITE